MKNVNIRKCVQHHLQTGDANDNLPEILSPQPEWLSSGKQRTGGYVVRVEWMGVQVLTQSLHGTEGRVGVQALAQSLHGTEVGPGSRCWQGGKDEGKGSSYRHGKW